ncbi:hypothetical protein K1T71_011486 [Dendrolimus kikuchii]|uniref:Uncharacterized protein n=1 Tax=Dendrolimus kikuchii TaxID=765133 RepID=A0ACC1CP06_9NEOP|nr:hypothetical protein K1T71_011486 [Dendrolimus kikuchii]
MAAGYVIGLIFVLGFVQVNFILSFLSHYLFLLSSLFSVMCVAGAVIRITMNAVNEQHIIDMQNEQSSSSRVVGGWPAEDTQIPYQVSLRMVGPTGGVSSCGGSIIHHEWILTAAHCLANRITFVVRLGLTNLTRPEYIVESANKYIHPEYDEIRAGVQTADIALVGLDDWIPYSTTIQPCRLQNSEQKNINYEGVRLVVSGYGRTDDLWNGGTASEILLWTFLSGVSNEYCLSWYPNSQVIKEQTVCAAYYNETSQSSCQGDSGGPLTKVDEDGAPTMIGVVSFGSSAGCNSPWPAGYVRPGHYHDWFLEVTGINFDWNSEDLKAKPIQLDYESVDQVKIVDF